MGKDIVITIGMDGTTPTVSWPQDDDCSEGGDRKACAHRNRRVTWELDGKLEGRAWAVLFTGGSPFKKGQAVFSPVSPGGMIKGASGGDFKYSVAVEDGDGEVQVLDPKIMVREEPPSQQERLYSMAAELEDLADDTESFQESLREIAHELEALAGSGEPHGSSG